MGRLRLDRGLIPGTRWGREILQLQFLQVTLLLLKRVIFICLLLMLGLGLTMVLLTGICISSRHSYAKNNLQK